MPIHTGSGKLVIKPFELSSYKKQSICHTTNFSTCFAQRRFSFYLYVGIFYRALPAISCSVLCLFFTNVCFEWHWAVHQINSSGGKKKKKCCVIVTVGHNSWKDEQIDVSPPPSLHWHGRSYECCSCQRYLSALQKTQYTTTSWNKCLLGLLNLHSIFCFVFTT